MIYDKLTNLPMYGKGELWDKICNFALSLSADTPSGFYPLAGERAFCRVLEYDTKQAEDCRIEAHKKYIDIQFTLEGAEGIDIFSKDDCEELAGYNEENDVIFYTGTGEPRVSAKNYEGCFTLLFLHDLHRPEREVAPYRKVKKAVIKLKANAYV